MTTTTKTPQPPLGVGGKFRPTMKVTKGPHAGFVGERFWTGPDKFRPGQYRVGLEAGGKKVFVNEWAVEEVKAPEHGGDHSPYDCEDCPAFALVGAMSEYWDGEPHLHAIDNWLDGKYCYRMLDDAAKKYWHEAEKWDDFRKETPEMMQAYRDRQVEWVQAYGASF